MRRRNEAWKIVLGLAVLFGMVRAAGAEIIYKIPTGFGWRQGVPLPLLDDDAVQSDLGLTAETAHALVQWKSAVTTAIDAEVPANAEPAKRLETKRLVEAKLQSQLDKILKLAQQERLHEIHLQKAGLNALSEGGVADALKLTSEQKEQILGIHRRMQREEAASVKTGRSSGHLSMGGRDEKLLELLSGDQKKMLAKLRGKPFDESGCPRSLRSEGRDIPVWNVRFSPDGSRLASSHHEQIVLWDIANGQRLLTMNGHKADVTSLAFGPDGKWLVSASVDRTVRSWDTGSGKNMDTIVGTSFGVRDGYRCIALSSDGKELLHAYGSTIANWYRFNPQQHAFAGGGTLYPGLGAGVPVWSVACSPAGTFQACGRSDGSVYVLQRGPHQKLAGHTALVFSVSFSADGKRLATASADGNIKVWDSLTGEEMLTLKAHDQAVRSVAFHPDGLRLASGGDDGVVKLWDLECGREILTLRRHEKPVTGVTFSPDGKRLATVGGDNTVRVWELPDGNETTTLSP